MTTLLFYSSYVIPARLDGFVCEELGNVPPDGTKSVAQRYGELNFEALATMLLDTLRNGTKMSIGIPDLSVEDIDALSKDVKAIRKLRVTTLERRLMVETYRKALKIIKTTLKNEFR